MNNRLDGCSKVAANRFRLIIVVVGDEACLLSDIDTSSKDVREGTVRRRAENKKRFARPLLEQPYLCDAIDRHAFGKPLPDAAAEIWMDPRWWATDTQSR